MKWFSLSNSDILIDIGGGTGTFAREFSSVVKRVILLDKEVGGYEDSLKKARIHMLILGNLNVDYLKGDAISIPIRSESIDDACCLEVLEHVYIPEIVFGEVSRVLKPNGIFVLSTPNSKVVENYEFPVSSFLRETLPERLQNTYVRYGMAKCYEKSGHLRSRFTIDELRTMAEKYDMELIASSYFYKRFSLLWFDSMDAFPSLRRIFLMFSFPFFALDQILKGEDQISPAHLKSQIRLP